MVTESVAILAITLCMIVVLVRAKHPDYAASTLPILIVPFVHLITLPLFRRYGGVFYQGPYQLLQAFADIAAVAVSCLCIVLLSGKIKSTKSKKLYVFLLSGYNIILTCAYVYQTLHPILMQYLQQSQ